MMTGTEKMETFPATQCYRAESSFGGAAMHVQWAESTAGKLVQPVELLENIKQVALSVLGTSFVNATLWRLFILMSL